MLILPEHVTTTLLKAVINKKGELRVKSGHPWIFRSDILSLENTTPGDIVDVVAPNGQFLGKAFSNPLSQITLRLFTRRQEAIGKDFWKRRVVESISRRRNRKTERLIFGEADFLPSLILDRYENVLVFQTLSAGMDRWREELLTIFEELLKPEAIVERNDPPVRELEGLLRQKGIVRGGFSSPLEITEGNKVFLVDPLEGQKTGLFLDQIDNHLVAAEYARGKTLDLFSYQGGFSLAVADKASEVLAVDGSASALAHLQKNCERNNVKNVKPLEANGFDFLRDCQEKREFFDTIILDPPPFVKDRKSLTGGVRGYKEINLRAMKILRPGGVLVTCSCSQNFTPAMFGEMLQESAVDAKREIQIIERRGASPDHPVLLTFPESSYLQCWILRVI